MANYQSHHDESNRWWPILIMVTLVLGCIFALNLVTRDKDNFHLSCDASLYHVENQTNSNRRVSLDVLSDEQQVEIRYDYYVDKQHLGSVRLSGKLLGLEVATMSYQFRITKGEVTSHVAQDKWPLHLRQILQNSGQALAGKEFDLTMKVSEMDIKKGYAVVRFEPGNNIWACHINPQD